MGKKPFSGKAKKAQLQEKNARKRGLGAPSAATRGATGAHGEATGRTGLPLFFESQLAADQHTLQGATAASGKFGGMVSATHDAAGTKSRFALLLTKESKVEIEKRTRKAQRPYEPRYARTLARLPPLATQLATRRAARGTRHTSRSIAHTISALTPAHAWSCALTHAFFFGWISSPLRLQPESMTSRTPTLARPPAARPRTAPHSQSPRPRRSPLPALESGFFLL
jgi:hypothetical protein